MNHRPGLVLICDFDETITTFDTGVLILDKFATGDWQTLDKLYDLNEIPIEEVMQRQFSMVKATKREMTRALDESISLRPGFKQLVEACARTGVPFVVASYGLDFCISHMLNRVGVERRVEVQVPKTRITAKELCSRFRSLG